MDEMSGRISQALVTKVLVFIKRVLQTDNHIQRDLEFSNYDTTEDLGYMVLQE